MPEIHRVPIGAATALKFMGFMVFSVILFTSCKDKVKEFDGFTMKELEYLVASDGSKTWLRILQEEDGNEIVPDDCGMDNRLIFIQDTLDTPKRILYAYNDEICDSLEFCDLHPDFCQADTTLCNADPEFCELLSKGTLYIGSWYVKEPFIKNDRADTLIFEINGKTESVWVTDITYEKMTIKYKNRKGENGGEITEYYKLFSPQSD